MKQEILNIIDFLTKPRIFTKMEKGQYGFYFFFDSVNYSNCYAGIIKGTPPRKHTGKETDLLKQIYNNDN